MALRCNLASGKCLAPEPPGFLPLADTRETYGQFSLTVRRSGVEHGAGLQVCFLAFHKGIQKPTIHTKVGRFIIIK